MASNTLTFAPVYSRFFRMEATRKQILDYVLHAADKIDTPECSAEMFTANPDKVYECCLDAFESGTYITCTFDDCYMKLKEGIDGTISVALALISSTLTIGELVMKYGFRSGSHVRRKYFYEGKKGQVKMVGKRAVFNRHNIVMDLLKYSQVSESHKKTMPDEDVTVDQLHEFLRSASKEPKWRTAKASMLAQFAL